jgi:prophage regulatory protein
MTLDHVNRLGSIAGKSGAVIRTKEVIELLGVSRMTLHRWIEAGRFPQPLKANGRTFGFNYNSVIEWMNCLEGKNNATGDKK